jgi:hypothetical protein
VTSTSKTPSFDTPEDKPTKANKVKTNYNACIQISWLWTIPGVNSRIQASFCLILRFSLLSLSIFKQRKNGFDFYEMAQLKNRKKYALARKKLVALAPWLAILV